MKYPFVATTIQWRQPLQRTTSGLVIHTNVHVFHSIYEAAAALRPV